MDELISTLPQPKTTADYKAALALLLKEIDHLNGQMEVDRADIERMKAETRVIGARVDARLARLKEELDLLRRGRPSHVETAT